MKKSPQYLRHTLTQAQSLQARYDALGAAGTQAVRNPMPMHKLVLSVLPILPDPASCITVETKTTATIAGKKLVSKRNETRIAGMVLPKSTWENNGMTVDEVLTAIQAKGFIARRSTVAMTLNTLRFGTKSPEQVQSMRFTRPITDPNGPRENTSYCRYFVRQ